MNGDTLFWGMFLTALIAATGLLWLAGVSATRMSVPSVVVAFYLAFAYLGLPALHYGWDVDSVEQGVTNRALVQSMTYYAGLALVVFSAALLFLRVLVGRGPAWNERRGVAPATRLELRAIRLLLLTSLVVFAWYLSQVPAIAIWRAVTGDLEGAAIARSDMTNNFVGPYWRYRLFFRTGLDFAAVALWSHYLATRTPSARWWAVTGIAAAVSSSLVAIEKSPLAMLIAMLYLAFVVARGGQYWQPETKYIALAGATITALQYILFMGAADLSTSFGHLWTRVLTGQLSPAYFYLELFPKHIPFLLGKSLPNPGGFLPFEPVAVPRVVQDYIVIAGPLDVVGSSPTAFWGEAYANFGTAGVMTAAVAVGLVVGCVALVLARVPASPSAAAGLVSIATHYSGLAMAGWSSYLFDTTTMFVLLVVGLGVQARRHDANRTKQKHTRADPAVSRRSKGVGSQPQNKS